MTPALFILLCATTAAMALTWAIAGDRDDKTATRTYWTHTTEVPS